MMKLKNERNNMNPKVKELMGETLDSKFSHTWTTLNYEDLQVFSEKFAELMLAEVDTVLMDGDRHRRDYFAAKVKEHFYGITCTN